jgi:16S rRNA G966 N2-methylase RsmD
MSNTTLKLADEVLMRFVQIMQEGIILGVDVTDIMRQVRLVPSENVLFLDPQYMKEVEEGHNRLLEQAEQLKSEMLDVVSGHSFEKENSEEVN